jgi:hypothetical protein
VRFDVKGPLAGQLDKHLSSCRNPAASAPDCSERGAVILIVLLIAVALIAFAAMAIDGSMVATSKTQQRYAAEKMALGALKSFVAAAGKTDSDKLKDALERAQELANEQGNVLLTDPFLKKGIATKELGTGISGTPSDGYVIPGKWHFSGTAVDCSVDPAPCPCQGGKSVAPCFQSYSSLTDFTTYGQPNAFQVRLHLRADSPIRTTFGSVIGGEYMYITSEATSALVPTRGVFAVDLSRSMTFDTHIPYEGSNKNIIEWVGEAAYKLKGNSCVDPSICIATDGCHFEGGNPTGMYDQVWNFDFSRTRSVRPLVSNASSTPSASGAYTPKPYTAHFRDDYECYEVSYTETGSPAVTEPYLVDTYSCQNIDNPKACPNPGFDPAAKGYDGPEPLTSALYGVREALDYFETRGVPGTKIGLIGFDQTAYVDIRKIDPAAPGSADYNTMKDIAEVKNQTNLTRQTRYRDHMFFPRPDKLSNIPQVLERAAFMLADDDNDGIVDAGGSNAENFIALISDGVTNCRIDGTCDSSDAGMAASIADAAGFVTNTLVPQKIKLHFLMFGSYGAPHTLLKKGIKNSSGCMDDGEAREANPPADFVDYNNGSAANIFTAIRDMYKTTPAAFYYRPNQFYELVRQTDGLWIPLRQPCNYGDKNACHGGALMDELDSKCAASADLLKSYGGYTDSYGRLTCDPHCFSIREQIESAVEQIAGRAPYVLVK